MECEFICHSTAHLQQVTIRMKYGGQMHFTDPSKQDV